MKHGKHYVDSAKLFDRTKLYDTEEAMDLCCKTAKAKFDETVELHVRLGVERREIVVGFEVGDTVKITDGPLAGFSGLVDELEPVKNRVRVVVSMFGRETPVDLELDQVETIKE